VSEASPPAPDESSKTTERPVSVRIAVILLTVITALLLLNAALTWLGRSVLAEAVAEARSVSIAEAERAVLLSLVPYALLGLVIGLSTWWLRQRQPWARWSALAATVTLAALTLLSILAAGGITVASLLLFVLSIGAISSLLSSSTGEWIPRLRGGA
jgi:hypothetical protein